MLSLPMADLLQTVYLRLQTSKYRHALRNSEILSDIYLSIVYAGRK